MIVWLHRWIESREKNIRLQWRALFARLLRQNRFQLHRRGDVGNFIFAAFDGNGNDDRIDLPKCESQRDVIDAVGKTKSDAAAWIQSQCL